MSRRKDRAALRLILEIRQEVVQAEILDQTTKDQAAARGGGHQIEIAQHLVTRSGSAIQLDSARTSISAHDPPPSSDRMRYTIIYLPDEA